MSLLRYLRSLVAAPPKPKPGECLARIEMWTSHPDAKPERKAS